MGAEGGLEFLGRHCKGEAGTGGAPLISAVKTVSFIYKI